MADGSAIATDDMTETAAEPVKGRKAKPRKKSAAKAKREPTYKQRKFKVDLWATDFNTAEIGILKRGTRMKTSSAVLSSSCFRRACHGGARLKCWWAALCS